MTKLTDPDIGRRHLNPAMGTCILVHGTWGTQSEFAFENSLFCKSLQNGLDHQIQFKRFEWSGKNSEAARRSASSALANFITSKLERPDEPVYIIAHSHGGNVAFDALRDEVASGKVAGLITLGTPFFSTFERGWVRLIGTIAGQLSIFGLVSGLLIAAVLSIIVALFDAAAWWLGLVGALYLGALLLGFRTVDRKYGQGSGLRALEAKIARAAQDRAAKIIAKSNAPVKANVVAIHTTADEAIWWLQRVTSTIDAPFFLLQMALKVLGWSMVIVITPLLMYEVFFGHSERVGTLFYYSFVIACASGVLLPVLCIVLILLVKALQRCIGTGPAIDFWNDVVTGTNAERLPRGLHGSLRSMHATIAGVYGGLWHSRYMRSGRVVDEIAKTVNQWQHNWPHGPVDPPAGAASG
jgi:hypothetical protein